MFFLAYHGKDNQSIYITFAFPPNTALQTTHVVALQNRDDVTYSFMHESKHTLILPVAGTIPIFQIPFFVWTKNSQNASESMLGLCQLSSSEIQSLISSCVQDKLSGVRSFQIPFQPPLCGRSINDGSFLSVDIKCQTKQFTASSKIETTPFEINSPSSSRDCTISVEVLRSELSKVIKTYFITPKINRKLCGNLALL